MALSVKIILWSRTHPLSLCATHVLGVLNIGADLSIGNPLYGDWRLPSPSGEPDLGEIWLNTIDLYASHKERNCPLFFALAVLLEVDALAHPLAKGAALRFFPSA